MQKTYKPTIFAWAFAIFFLIGGLSAFFVRACTTGSERNIFFGLMLWAIFTMLALLVVHFFATHVALGQAITLSELPRRDFFVVIRYGNRVFLEECAHQWIPFGARQYAVVLTEPIDFPPMFAHVGNGRIVHITDPSLAKVRR